MALKIPIELDPDKTLNPYIAARRKWDAHVGDAVFGRMLWQAIAVLSLLVALATMAWAAHRDLQPKLLPYVVEVDRLGNAQGVRIADQLKGSDTRNFETAVRVFVTQARLVTIDAAIQRQAVLKVAARLTEADPAYGKYLEEFGQEPGRDDNPNFPFERAKRETVSTEIVSVLQQSEQSWEAEWVETVFDRSGRRTARVEMRGLFQVYQASELLTEDQALSDNPLGIYIRHYSWGPKQPGEGQ